MDLASWISGHNFWKRLMLLSNICWNMGHTCLDHRGGLTKVLFRKMSLTHKDSCIGLHQTLRVSFCCNTNIAKIKNIALFSSDPIFPFLSCRNWTLKKERKKHRHKNDKNQQAKFVYIISWWKILRYFIYLLGIAKIIAVSFETSGDSPGPVPPSS